jgi:uncharacterized protein YdaU (DUF1376 family)
MKKNTSKSPAFQFYPQDFLADINVKLMTTEAVGAYLLLLCHDWIEIGIPDDDGALAILSGMREHWTNIREQVMKCFKKRGKKFFNHRLEEEREKQNAFRLKKIDAGKASAKSRERKKLHYGDIVNTCSTDVPECSTSVPTHVDKVFEQNSTLQSSSSSSTSVKEKEKEKSPSLSKIHDPLAAEMSEDFQALAEHWKSLGQFLDPKSRDGIRGLLALDRPIAEIRDVITSFLAAKRKASPADWLSSCTLKGLAEGHYADFVSEKKAAKPNREAREAVCPQCNRVTSAIVDPANLPRSVACANPRCGCEIDGLNFARNQA